MEPESVWSIVRDKVDSVIRDAAPGDAPLERFLRRKLENWAINRGSGRVNGLKAKLRKHLYESQGGLCAQCGEALQKVFELDRIDPSYADEADQGYRLGNVRAVHQQCNPRGPHPGGRARRSQQS